MKYSASQNETWDLIAHRIYGDAFLFPKLQEANPNYVTVLFFSGGEQLDVPELAEEETAEAAPWNE